MKKKVLVNRIRIEKILIKHRKSQLKKKIKNGGNSNGWKVQEINRENLKHVKFPKRRVRLKFKKINSNKVVTLMAPIRIDYYYNNDRNYEITNKFINDLKDCTLKNKRRVLINFSETNFISAAAMLSLLAEVDVILRKSPHARRAISFSHPKNEKIESILKQVGFYDLLRKVKRKTKDYDDVTFWKYTSGSLSQPVLANEMLAEIRKSLKSHNSKKLYRGFIEAMSNSVEHAYIEEEPNSESKWWTFAGIHEDQVIVVICDKGVGIPSTLPNTQGPNILRSFFETLGVSLNNVADSSYIKAAASLSRTRTGQANRGKGFTDITSVIDTIGSGMLSIFSNKGRYIYKGNQGLINDMVKDYKTSVCGTIVEWVFPLKNL
ncbi:ATP-binding protein [Pantoea agglomerans]|uniref:ATP-binding protein n=1 Tax=Enterobacter agglomerans TaxID=549 RepID=UPI003C7AD12B